MRSLTAPHHSAPSAIPGQQLGYATACDAFAAAATAGDADGVIAELVENVRGWHGDQPPNDDVTFVVVRAI